MFELEASQANFSFDLQRISRLRKCCSKSGIIGQPRALSALKMGMNVNSKGYNIFISGEDGTGRHSAVRQLAGQMKINHIVPSYHRNTEDERSPYLSCTITKELVCPSVVEEHHPTYENIFGKVLRTDKGEIKVEMGSLLKACGGFLVLDAEQVTSDEKLWKALKIFASSSTFILSEQTESGSISVRPIFEDNVPVKIILLGSDELFDKLCDNDEGFLKLFKVSAEFDFSMPANDENISGTIAYILELAQKYNMKEVSDDALCELLTYSSWYAEMRDELTTKLAYIGDLLFEANFFAHDIIDAKAVKQAITERNYANGLTESRINQEIENGEMIISLQGTKVGVVNGLAVMDRGLVSFGTPAVISVSVAPGSEGIVNIEHEAGLSGEIHDKGLLILEGYLRKQYARNFALSLYAGICFEQSYSEVDGDSASSSELFALLSAIGELPVRQEIAVTGSVNQLGDIQIVGGINEKITGFFDICEKKGLTGHQGVIIPSQNVKSLILEQKIVDAIENKKFHIYPISTIDEGMEILTLRDSGKRNAKGLFPVNTVNRIIEDNLRKLYELSRPAN